MTTVSATNLRDRIGDVLNRVLYGGDRVLIERRGQPVAAVISIEELRRLERLEDERDTELLRMAKALNTETATAQDLLDLYATVHGERLEETERD